MLNFFSKIAKCPGSGFDSIELVKARATVVAVTMKACATVLEAII